MTTLSLRLRVLIGVTLGLAVSVALAAVVVATVLADARAELERRLGQESLARIETLLAARLDHLKGLVATAPLADLPDADPQDVSAQIDFALRLDADGNVVAGWRRGAAPLPRLTFDASAAPKTLPATGLLTGLDGPFLAVVSRNDDAWTVIGQPLPATAAFNRLRGNVNFWPLPNPDLAPDLRSYVRSLRQDGPVRIAQQGAELFAYGVIRSLDRRPALLVRVAHSAAPTVPLADARNAALAILPLVALIGVAVAYFVLDRQVAAPLARLSARMAGVARPRRYAAEPDSVDGLARLTGNVLGSLSRSRDAAGLWQQRFSATLDQLPDGVALYGPDDRLVYANPALHALYPRHAAALRPGQRFEDLLLAVAETAAPGQDTAARARWARAQLDAHRTAPRTHRLRHQDGETIEIDERRLPDGSMLGIHRRHEDLPDAAHDGTGGIDRHRLQTVLDNLFQGVTLFDPGGRLDMWNHRYVELMDFPMSMIFRGQTLEALVRYGVRRGRYGPLIHRDDEERLVRERMQVLETPEPAVITLPGRNGRLVEIRDRWVAGLGFVLNYTDVTRFRDIEAALKRSEHRFRDLVEASSDWYWEMDARLKFTYFSEGFQERLKADPTAILGRRREQIRARDHGISEAAWEAHLATLEAHQPFREFTYRIPDATGAVRWIKTSGKPVFDDDGRFQGYRGTGSDITAEVTAREAAGRAQAHLATALECLSEAIAVFDPEDRLVAYNKPFLERGAAFSHRVRPGITFEELMELSEVHGLFAIENSGAQSWASERREHHRQGDGSRLYARANGGWEQITERRTPDGGRVVLYADVSDIKREEEARRREALEIKSRLLQTTLDNLGQGVCVTDAAGRLTNWNSLFAELLEVRGPLHSGMPVAALHDAQDETLTSLIDDIARKDNAVGLELERRRADGRVLELRRNPMPDGGAVSILRDITDRKRAEETILFMATHDPLTVLPNRALFLDRLRQAMATAMRHGRKVALLYFDLDGFKDINDTLGHALGDETLREVARRIKRMVRSADTFARLGGDEFAIIQTDLHERRDADDLAQRIDTALHAPITLADHQMELSASIGITLFPDDGTDPDILLRNADLAMYRAKSVRDLSYCHFDAEMDRELQRRRSLEVDLRDAVRNDVLVLHFQPKLGLDDGRVTGVEALLRWPHPERGPVAPRDFVPLAEQAGLIEPLGGWVLETACAQIARWHADDLPPFPVAINLSPLQLTRPDLPERIAATLARHGLPADRLEIEITETALVQETDQIRDVLDRIDRLGIRIALDDFGTGYSSLGHLKRFPVHAIKIDQSFVRDLGGTRSDTALVEAMIGLSRTLGLVTIAEGAESPRHTAALAAMGCDQVQGFAIARPMADAQLVDWLRAHHKEAARQSTGR